MGCYPLGKMMSRAFGKSNGKGRRRARQMIAYSSPPSYCCHGISGAKYATLTDDIPVISVRRLSIHNPPETDVVPSVHAECVQNNEPQPDRIRCTCGPHPDPLCRVNPCGLCRTEPGSGCGHVPSPLTRWGEAELPRPEYFGGEYRHYPTPVRQRIYSIATDANRLTAIFSEENPNACNIV